MLLQTLYKIYFSNIPPTFVHKGIHYVVPISELFEEKWASEIICGVLYEIWFIILIVAKGIHGYFLTRPIT